MEIETKFIATPVRDSNTHGNSCVGLNIIPVNSEFTLPDCSRCLSSEYYILGSNPNEEEFLPHWGIRFTCSGLQKPSDTAHIGFVNRGRLSRETLIRVLGSDAVNCKPQLLMENNHS